MTPCCWPEQTDDTTGVSDQLNRVTKYVVSATITDPQWRNSVVLAVVLTGSITLAHLLIAEGMADEFRMFCCPAVQGTGRRFFPEGYAARLARVDARTFGNGVTYVACRPTGSHDA
ncbi:MAG: dihydrofolate reductase family protein [Micropruina glycogenica]